MPCRSLGEKPHFFVSLGTAENLEFSKLSSYIEVVPLKPFLYQFKLCLYCKYSRSYEVL